ncbi:hypothetical protein SK128_015853 [Halocaridina rubra]|uniref:Prisilkin-39-like n=1 Tax=Halocaridina rubra TaxID=373956 RepID=A0AAN8XCY8_HALRR
MRILVVLLLAALAVAEQKREANPHYTVPSYGYGVVPYGYGYHLPYRHQYGYGYGTQLNPYDSSAYVHSYQHSIHKRSAEANPSPILGYRYGYPPVVYENGYPNLGYGYGYRPQGFGYGDGAVYGYTTEVKHPGNAYSYQHKDGIVPPSYGYYY